MRNQTELEKELEKEIFVDRMLVLLETDAGFVQFHFTPKHFKKVSDAVASGFALVERVGENEVLNVRIGEDAIPKMHFEGMRDFYEADD